MGLSNIITREDVYNKIGCQRVFNHYFGPFELSKSYHSVLRDDNKKSTGFYVNKHGRIIYNDFCTNEKYDCVSFVRKYLSIVYKKPVSYTAALEDIQKTFNLDGTGEVYIPPPVTIKKPKKKVFKVYVRPFTNEDLAWWGSYYITEEELKKHNVYSVRKVEVGKAVIVTRRKELKYAYLFREGDDGYFKIYSPLSLDSKWFFNAPLNLVYGLDFLEYKSDTLIITKSLKDFIVLKKVFPDVIALQNESVSAIKEEVIDYLKEKYSEIVVVFDTDRPGIKALNTFCKRYDLTPFYIKLKRGSIWQSLMEAKKINIKDPSDFIKEKGFEEFKNYLKNIHHDLV